MHQTQNTTIISKNSGFANLLLKWYDVNQRDLPWRGKSGLYEIWLSEVMLQQTQVDYVQRYYQNFLEAFPTLDALASADLDDVLRLWEGMGYYARARNLHVSAKKVVESVEYPGTAQELHALPGLGPYSSRAIASIVFGEAVAAVDGNVRRVVSRLFAHRGNSAKEIQDYADSLLCDHRPGDYNQAMMELGAQVCKPKRPQCRICPVKIYCKAFLIGTPEAFPAPKKKRAIPHYDVAVGVLRNDVNQIFIQQRATHGLLGGLWELPGGKAILGESGPETCKRELFEELGVKVVIGHLIGQVNHAYSHFKITLRAYECTILDGMPISGDGLKTAWVNPSELNNYAFPRANRRILELLAPK